MIEIGVNDSTLLTISRARRASDGSLVTTGTVTWLLRTHDLEAIDNGSYTHISSGNWQGTVPYSLGLQEHESYWLDITIATTPTGLQAFFRIPAAGIIRGKEE